MSYKAPVSGQYITFPIDIQRCVEISWKENYVDCTAMYYTTRCFWGYRKDVPFVPAPLAGPPPKTTETLAKTVANKSWPPVKGTTEAEPTKKIDIRGIELECYDRDAADRVHQARPTCSLLPNTLTITTREARWPIIMSKKNAVQVRDDRLCHRRR